MPWEPVKLAQELVREVVSPGQAAVDATAGNGKDTRFLAQLVGATGLVFAFDIQERALKATKQALRQAGLEQQVKLIHDGHQNLKRYVDRPLAALMFNLGYLPGGDHGVTTDTANTLVALEQGLDLVVPGGVITVVEYPGHPGGEEEAQAVETWAGRLPRRRFSVWRWHCLNPRGTPPRLVAIAPRRDTNGRLWAAVGTEPRA